MRRFDSGVLVVQSLAQSDENVVARLQALLAENSGTLTALAVAHAFSVPLPLAMEHLRMAEQREALCRDETLQQLVFYPNLFATVAA